MSLRLSRSLPFLLCSLLLALFVLAEGLRKQSLEFLVFKLLAGLDELGLIPNGRVGNQRRARRQKRNGEVEASDECVGRGVAVDSEFAGLVSY